MSAVPSTTIFDLDNFINPSFRNGLSESSKHVSLPNAVVHSHDFPILSSNFVLEGQHRTILRYKDGNPDQKNLIAKETSSSITLAWCTLNNSVHHFMPIVEDLRTDSTADPFDMNMVGTRMANMKVVGADGVCRRRTIATASHLLRHTQSLANRQSRRDRPSLSTGNHFVSHKCDSTDCSPADTQSLFYSYDLPSLVMDTCSFTRCAGGKTLFDFQKTFAFVFFCSFANVTGTQANVVMSESNDALFIESCRFDLWEDPNVLDAYVPMTEHASVNDTMFFGTFWYSKEELAAVQVVSVEDKNEMRVGTWPTDPEEDPVQQIQPFSTLSDALAQISPSPVNNIIAFWTGSFAETIRLEVSQLVEIVGAGSNVSKIHSTQLTTGGFTSKSAGKLTLDSLQLIPWSSSSVLGSTADSGSLCVLGTSSLAVSNTIFVTITRTSSAPSSVDVTQCASCIEGATSGTVEVLYSRFGACTTKGRAGAIDLEKNGENSAVEMSSCYFDQNSAGEGVPDAVRGDDVVLKPFDDSNTRLDLSTIKSFPSLFPFLLDSDHPIVPPPAHLLMSSAAVDKPLAWSYRYDQISKSLLEKHTLQFLLESRLRNNSQSELTTNFVYCETMTPFVFQNSTVSVYLSSSNSILTVDQEDEVFVTLQKASLSFRSVQFAFVHLTTPAFTCDDDSSITLLSTNIKLTTPTLTRPFIESTGPLVSVEYLNFVQAITLDNTPFIRLNRTAKDAVLNYQATNPLLAAPLTAPFIVCEGAKEFVMKTLTLNYAFDNSASIMFAKDSALSTFGIQVQLLKSTAQGAFLHLENCTIIFQQDSYTSSSGGQGGLLFCRNTTITHASILTSTSCSATQGGVLFCVESSVTLSGVTFTKHNASEGGVFFLEGSTVNLDGGTFSNCEADEGGLQLCKEGRSILCRRLGRLSIICLLANCWDVVEQHCM
ncbi:hypothetical protein BLNAU_14721 [Blattamonas nauphoetae]|uniref:Right handed beta helix domain-containing protein n=1 Tax=Blattamonas nauphoetae TaxID=2049346 RepID=A0ABQ9XGG0_9EUKA|nr:hypothetical protein BLNAU_14721 [Blattamonas nauphoetae]